MKVITEAMLREQLRGAEPKVYFVPEGKILSPAAREYLQQRKIRVAKGEPAGAAGTAGEEAPAQQAAPAPAAPRYVDGETGAFYTEKPEHMTQLHGDVLVEKGDPRIAFRGKLDSLQAQVVLAQALLHEGGGNSRVIADLGGLLSALREMMRCDVLGEEYRAQPLLGMSHEELRERSHDPMRFFNIQRMELPDYQMGKPYALLNFLRTQAREAEVAAAQAFRSGRRCTRPDLVEALNSMSSALHIMMCMVLAGQYGK